MNTNALAEHSEGCAVQGGAAAACCVVTVDSTTWQQVHRECTCTRGHKHKPT